MAMHRKRRWPGIAAGYTAFLAVLGAITALIYEDSAPLNRPAVLRLAVTFVVAVMLIHMRRYVRGDPLWDPPSDFERALSAEPPPATLPPELAKLRDEITNATQRRSRFEDALWPRLVALAGSRGTDPAKLGSPSLSRRRGPSLGQLSALINRIEDSP
jgi:hypothetical protein